MTRSFLLTVYARENIGFPHHAEYFSPFRLQTKLYLPAARLTQQLFQGHRRTESSELWATDRRFGTLCPEYLQTPPFVKLNSRLLISGQCAHRTTDSPAK